ncbi:hypothetical protein [Hymenobacter jeollabukensis]|uniref:Uncharacterized protein n=1 Tax=Hymenobacter jeollabukensis TaxID=2025313 RepID=A0A5R8WPX6_9BACT|nr:hypothetical protein [Hymenobacter jeollabukensis]TLM92348.1 hypothetical protein FDY95_13010 [Hymenobacter jeollabukensis]
MLLTELMNLAWLAVRLAPRLLWWLLAGLLLAALNQIFRTELWPNTPGAEPFFKLVALCCGLPLPWLLARTAQRLGRQLRGWFWRLFWRLAAVAGYVGAFIISVVGLIGLAYQLLRVFS